MQPEQNPKESWLPLTASLSIGIAAFLWFAQFKNDSFVLLAWLAYPFAVFGLWQVPKIFGFGAARAIQKWMLFGGFLLAVATIRRLEPTLSTTIEIALIFILSVLAIFHEWFTYEGKKAFYSVFVALLWLNALAPVFLGNSMPQYVGRGEKFMLLAIAVLGTVGFFYVSFLAKPPPSSAVNSRSE